MKITKNESPRTSSVAIWILPGNNDQEVYRLDDNNTLDNQMERFTKLQHNANQMYQNVRIERTTQVRLFTLDLTMTVRRSLQAGKGEVQWRLERPVSGEWKTLLARRPERMMERLLANVNPDSVHTTETSEHYKLMVGAQFLGEMIIVSKCSNKHSSVSSENLSKRLVNLK